MYHLSEAYLMATYICLLASYLGALLFGTAVVAPIAVGSLSENQAGAFLRRYWVIYHRIAVIGGLLFAGAAALGSTASAVPAPYALLIVCLTGLMTLCFYVAMTLIPSINHAKDAGDTQTFARLHRRNVSLVSFGMLTPSAVDRAGLCPARSIYLLADRCLRPEPHEAIAEDRYRGALLTQYGTDGVSLRGIGRPSTLQYLGLFLTGNVHNNLLSIKQTGQGHADALVRGRWRIDEQTGIRRRGVQTHRQLRGIGE